MVIVSSETNKRILTLPSSLPPGSHTLVTSLVTEFNCLKKRDQLLMAASWVTIRIKIMGD